ncbi:unnamed protein product [Onchocerca flexuosa]|uniref:RBB1NT domain-containing protein n=1 Tax=Onchocerca flexuosa TaxID=387005 RepID=A0A183H772_9BILA|nr:unnamed protein product [Onchocerca flexuosa]
MHRRNLEHSKRQRQQSTSTSVGDKEGDGERGDDATSSEDGSTLESTTSSTTLSATSNSINEVVTIPAKSGRALRTRQLARKSERKRQGLRDKEVEPMTKKRSRDNDGTKKLYKVGSVVAVYDDIMRKGKWTPAVVVAEVPFKAATKGNVNIGKSDILLRSFKDSKYFICPVNKLSSPGTSVLKFAESSPKAAMDRAIAFIEKEIFPAGWDRSQIYDDDVRSKKREHRSSSIDHKKRSEASGKAKREIEKKTH